MKLNQHLKEGRSLKRKVAYQVFFEGICLYVHKNLYPTDFIIFSFRIDIKIFDALRLLALMLTDGKVKSNADRVVHFSEVK